MFSLNQLTPVMFLFFAYLLYQMIMNEGRIDMFVPSNSFEVPQTIKAKDWQVLNDKFGTLVQLVNTTTFDVAYKLDDMVDALNIVLNNSGVGKFNILSVGESQQFTLLNVVVQDVATLAVTKFKRVDFIVESQNPYKIQKVIITPEKEFLSSQNVVPTDKMKPDMFRYMNPLHLPYPYRSSDNEMMVTEDDKVMFEKNMTDKAVMLKTLSKENPDSKFGAVPSQNSPLIVGAGPLHPLGL